MLKSLYSGVSGLQSHQVAMDIESNNIANVNTTGFKYSRANFSDLLAQTSSIATAPQGNLGGKNAVQVGLGSTVSSQTRIFSQGSIQNSDKNTDVAIQGDGFFIISPDAGNTYKFTRAGDFKFDAGGNFVDNNGFISQGWLRDKATGKVDSTAPITSINIAPGLTTPASPTTEVVLKANLNSGTLVKSFSPAYEVKSGTPPSQVATPIYTGDAVDAAGNPIDSGNVGVMFNEVGEAFSLQKNQGIWASFISATTTGTAVAASSGNLTANGGAQDNVAYTFSAPPVAGDTISVVVNNSTYSAAFNVDAATTYADLKAAVETGEGVANMTVGVAGNVLTFTNLTASVATAGSLTNDNGSGGAAITVAPANDELDVTFTLDDGTTKQITTSGGTGVESAAQNASRYVSAINAQTVTTGISATYDVSTNKINLVNDNSNPNASHNINIAAGGVNSGLDGATQSVITAYKYQYDPTGKTAIAGANKTFTTLSDLRYAMEVEANSIDTNGDATVGPCNVEIRITDQGKFEIINLGGATDSYDMNLKITGLKDVSGGITENSKFTANMSALSAVLPAGTTGKAFSQAFNAATHSSSIDIFDSLGSKHTIRMEFRKTALDATTGSTWSMKVSVPLPASIDTVAPTNEKTGSIRFNNDGSLATYNPPNISFSGNNGSAPDQQVNLSFGTANAFDGMTSFDSNSSTSGISQDGFTGGDLVGIRIDQSGTIVGSFSNGRSFGLAQIAMAKFTNNEGLATEGGNVYIQTANSGDPIIGTAATSGRGFIQSSALEASNVDLSRALTQLIIIQRGYQANGKTITTSDQLLQTLIGLKN
ncbi:MAG: flagellar hook protein FlgE [Helicobacteraceae bacterium CG2_30_36_10]|nr:MAG: flagellar hook protein FlgE [Helicobacteraceae bacterium CG2_30_36_10]